VLCVNWGEEASIWEMQGPGDWCKIGGDCDHLYGYNDDLFCVNSEDAGIWWNNSRFEEHWERVGDRCKQLHVCDGGLFCVNNEDCSIWKRDCDGNWGQVGTDAGVVYGASGWQSWMKPEECR